MTRKDYRILAAALRAARPDYQEPDVRLRAWSDTVRAIADALSDASGYDLNGNRRFNRETFYAAAGLSS